MDTAVLVRRITTDFNNAITEVEALADYYVSFKNVIAESQIKVEKDYRIGIALITIFDNIMDKEESERNKAVEDAKTQTIDGVSVNDIVEISVEKKENKMILKYSLKDKYSSSDKYVPDIVKRKIHFIESQREIFVRSVLSNIVITYEMYLANVYRFLVLRNPNAYFEGATVKISELFNTKVSKIISSKVEQEVSSKMFDSLEVLDKIEEKSGINIDRYVHIRKEFEEIYYRRNIFVHNNGVVNELYLSKVNDKYKKGIVINNKLVCDELYLCNAICILKKIICTMFYELLNKLEAPDDAYYPLSENVGFSALESGDFSFAEHIYGILRKHKGFKFAYKALHEINYINSLKQQGKSIDYLLNDFDVSAMTDVYKIAKECLLNNNEEVYVMLTETYPGTLDAMCIRDWPIFINFRNTEYYKRFKMEHADDFKEFIFAGSKEKENMVTDEISETTGSPSSVD